MNTNTTTCVRHQCAGCGRYVEASTVDQHTPGGGRGWCPQHRSVDVHCGTRRQT